MGRNRFCAIALIFFSNLSYAGLTIMDEGTPSPPTKSLLSNKTIEQIKPIIVPKQQWKAIAGSTLKESLTQWASKANWTIIWMASIDYPILAPITFEGSFDQAVSQFILLYERAEKPLVVDIQPQQNLIHINNRNSAQ